MPRPHLSLGPVQAPPPAEISSTRSLGPVQAPPLAAVSSNRRQRFVRDGPAPPRRRTRPATGWRRRIPGEGRGAVPWPGPLTALSAPLELGPPGPGTPRDSPRPGSDPSSRPGPGSVPSPGPESPALTPRGRLTPALAPPRQMPPRGGSARGPKQTRSRRRPCRHWRSLLPDLERMVPWPRGGGGHRTQAQVLENVLGYIRYLQRILSIAQGGAGRPGDSDTVEVGLSAGGTWGPPRQRLVPYKEEEEEEEEMGGGSGPWLGPTGPYWEALDWDGGVPLTPCPGREGLLGLSPSLLASPPPPGPPDEVVRGPSSVTAGGSGRWQPGDPQGGRGDGRDTAHTGTGCPPPPQEEMCERVHHVLPSEPETLHEPVGPAVQPSAQPGDTAGRGWGRGWGR
ncbi:uncharacterized protein LOC141917399 isoform X2 [Strix aluco]|uniref:uncharacterized protein LOC141917399 isoform X2 n=1 Tax=Strix aluco TaxID=111821 RepID=UPI003DA2610D